MAIATRPTVRWLPVALLALGCTESVEIPTDPGLVVPQLTPDSGSPIPACFPPPPPYGASPGRVAGPLTFDTCDDEPFHLYGPDYCLPRLTVLHIVAGWCGPARQESDTLSHDLEPFDASDVRVVEVIIQDNEYEAPDAAFCDEWRSQYGLEMPVLVDPTQQVQLFIPGGGLPATVVLDREGHIVHRSVGHGDLGALLDELLASDLP